MVGLSSLFFVVLTIGVSVGVSGKNVIYSVTFVSCVQGSTCPQNNPTNYNRTYALNGTISPNVPLTVGDRLEFDLMVNLTNHPLTICQNSPIPKFCQGVADNDKLNTPITLAGTNTSFTFDTAGIYYYGCFNHPGMGAVINVTKSTNGGHHLYSTTFFIPIILLLTVIFI